MPQIKNFYNIRPDELEPGVVLVATVTLHITRSHGGKPLYRVYRCGYPPETSEGIPQGASLPPEHARTVMQALFPVVRWTGAEVDV